jgi:sugar lactone lactonase YvrE
MATAILLASAGPAAAVETRFWEIAGYESLLEGEVEGLSLTREGELLLAPDLISLPLQLDNLPPQPFLWRAVPDRKGNLFVASGIRGVVYRVSPEGEVSPFFQASEIDVHALAVDSQDRLLVGASPPARIYRVDPDGRITVLFEPPERYLWDMVVRRDDTLFVATGEQGVLYRVSSDGEGEVHFDSDEPHLVSLAIDVDGMLFIGSSGSGRVFRVGPDGSAEVLLDADAEEVARVALAPGGTVFAATNRIVPRRKKEEDDKDKEPEERLSGELPRAATPAPRGLEDLAATTEEVLLDGRREEVPLALRSALHRIPPVGPTVVVWESDTEGIHSLMASGEDRIYFGTGVPGHIYLIDGVGAEPRLLARLPESQVTALAGGDRAPLFAITSNPGRIYRAVEDHGHAGDYLSPVRDSGSAARWGQVSWEAVSPAGARVEVVSRSGNSSTPDNTWSDWSPAYRNPDGARIASPPGRFLQLRASLSRLGDAPTPRLRSLRVSYQEENRAPRLENLTVAAPDSGKEDDQGAESARQGTPRQLALTWESTDPNGDELQYDLTLEPLAGEETAPSVRQLATGWGRTTFLWDTSEVPGGRYRVAVRATDMADNDVDSALTARLRSAPLVVDRQPPEIEVLSLTAEDGIVRLSFRAADTVSPVVRADYTVGEPAGRRRAAAADGMDDDLEERYDVVILDLEPGSHHIELTARDREGNRGRLRVPVEVTP